MEKHVEERCWVEGWSVTRLPHYHNKLNVHLSINKAGLGELFFDKETEKRIYRESIDLTKKEMLALADFIYSELQPSRRGN